MHEPYNATVKGAATCMEIEMQKPKPCPFYGSDHLTVKQNPQLDGMAFIVCGACGLVASFHGNERRKDQTLP